jgi:cytochrome bd-type quinol oxidase subunit 2
MTMLKPSLWLVTIAFTAFSLWVLLQIGYLGIWQGGFANLGSTQITVDLVIACLIGIGFIARDCRAQGRAWWPWAVLTLVAGSIGLLAYLLWPKR